MGKIVQKTLTSFDLAAIVFELREQLKDAHIQNIYQLKERILLLKLRQRSRPSLNLLIEPGRRIHITSYLLKKPPQPPTFCMALRKHLRNGVITEICQREFDRIVAITVKTREGEFRLISEFFGDGNIILVDPQGTTRQALTFKRMRDRNILRGEPFKQAPPSGKDPRTLTRSDLPHLARFNNLEVVKALTRYLSISGMYAEEILLRANISKHQKCSSLKRHDFDKIFRALTDILSYLEPGKLEPCIIVDTDEEAVDRVPFHLRQYENYECKQFESFNEALDEYYAKTVVESRIEDAAQEVKQKIDKQRRILREQQKSLIEMKRQAERKRKIGDQIYVHFTILQTLRQRIMKEKKKGRTWREIVSRLEAEKKNRKVPSTFFESFDTRNVALHLSIEDSVFSLNLRKSIQENAATYYEQAKKARRKTTGTEKAIQETLNRIEELKQHKKRLTGEAAQPIKKQRKRAWFEKFWWFHTSEDFLTVGGKDAVTNEVLIKKHTASHDLVFHADIAGAPFVLLKTEGRTPSQESIREAAQLAATHSRAWKAKFSAIDVYWVHPEQVSKSPPSGEHLKKGAFMIRGKKNYVRKVPLRVAIGIDFRTTPPALTGGPINAVKDKTDIFVEIVPGDHSSSRLAHQIRHTLAEKAPPNLREAINTISTQEIQSFIPFGNGNISNIKTR